MEAVDIPLAQQLEAQLADPAQNYRQGLVQCSGATSNVAKRQVHLVLLYQGAGFGDTVDRVGRLRLLVPRQRAGGVGRRGSGVGPGLGIEWLKAR